MQRQLDEEWVERVIGDDGLSVYRRVEGAREWQDLENELLLTESSFLEIMEWMQKKGVISVIDERGAPIMLPNPESRRKIKLVAKETVFEGQEAAEPTKRRVYDIWGRAGEMIYDAIDGSSELGEIYAKTRLPEDKVKKIVAQMEEEGVLKVEKEQGRQDEKEG